MSTVNVVGLGYIGLPTALMFATHGVSVVGTDYNRDLNGDGRLTASEALKILQYVSGAIGSLNG